MSVRGLSLFLVEKGSETRSVGICENFFEKYVYLPEKLSDNGCHFKKLVPLSEREREREREREMKKKIAFSIFQIVAQLLSLSPFRKLTFMIKKVFFVSDGYIFSH